MSGGKIKLFIHSLEVRQMKWVLGVANSVSKFGVSQKINLKYLFSLHNVKATFSGSILPTISFSFRTNSENETFTRIRRDPNGLKLPMSPSGKILSKKKNLFPAGFEPMTHRSLIGCTPKI